VAISRTPNRTTVPIVSGAIAYRVADAQGHEFGAIIAAQTTADHQQTGAIIDAEDDRLRDRLADKLTVAAALAKREGAYETHNVLVAAIAIVRRQNELDAARDHHLITEASTGVSRILDSTYRATAVLESLLTGRESICGAVHPQSDALADEGVRVLRCDRGAEWHAAHVFVAEPMEGGS
jgi:hypothetical protein